MKTPICDFIENYADKKTVRMHMPGHKGNGALAEEFDITEIEGADVLYAASGIIKESQEIASSLFGSGKTLYSTEGSSLSIRAMLYLAVVYAKAACKKPLIAAARNAHKVFITAAALLDFEIDWLHGGDSFLSCNVTADGLERYFENAQSLPVAVYLTSPDYLGNTLDIKAISKVCHAFGVLLLVDNAHGAYLEFLESSRHPLSLGADICCDSAHKTLPVLTGGGYLHVSKDAPPLFFDMAENAMALFASTSPSYLILRSLDKANAYIAGGYRERLSAFAKKVECLKEKLSAAGYTLCGDEPLKVTVAAKGYGYAGESLASVLREKGIICEFCDCDFLTLMLTPENSDRELKMLEDALLSVKKSVPIAEDCPKMPSLERVLSIREAVMAPSEEIDVSLAGGRILASPSVLCPPAVSVAICGERLNEDAIDCFRYYGIKKCRVVLEN